MCIHGSEIEEWYLAGVDNGAVAGAAAQVSIQADLEVVSRQRLVVLRRLPQHAVHRDHEAGCAVATL